MKASRTGNRFLDALSLEASQRLLAASRHVRLQIGTSLYGAEEEPRCIWFLTAGIASVTFTPQRGTTIELAALGRDGVVGAFSILGGHKPVGACGMQLSGAGYRMPINAFQAEFRDSLEVRGRLLEFVQQQMDMAYQLVACNRLHRANQRFARWLLMVQDRVELDVLPMTQEFLADMLGTRRTTVVEAAGELQRLRAIEYRRGIIRIADRQKLLGEACECYPLLKGRYDQLYLGAASPVV